MVKADNCLNFHLFIVQCLYVFSTSVKLTVGDSSALLPVCVRSRRQNADPDYRKHSRKVTFSNINMRRKVIDPPASFTCPEMKGSSAETYAQNPSKKERGERYSRSGRRLILPLQYWRGERQVWDQAMIVRLEEGGTNYLTESMASESKETSSKTSYHALVKRKKTTEVKEQAGCCNLDLPVVCGVNVPSLIWTNSHSTEDTAAAGTRLPSKKCVEQKSQDEKMSKKVVPGDIMSLNIVEEDLDSPTSLPEPVHSGEMNRGTFSGGDKLFSSGNQDLPELQNQKYREKNRQETNAQMRRILERLNVIEERQREMQDTLNKVHLCLQQNKRVAMSLLTMPEGS
ncbi:uncharacterized protein LOC112958192 [Nothoprocta perdicaria]|uniref:uncharacterized protein LOC112958192 n=1 Tax=Nothoprocta perdicaria TaxID=30464 RepID=UPI000E1BA96F|nr:uncharacterized protein LOC112958192 [Nothoprocta perdicaria]